MSTMKHYKILSQEFINSWKKKIVNFQFVVDTIKLLEIASNI